MWEPQQTEEEKLKEQTKQLIHKLKLKPKLHESVYSQSFISRERNIVRRLKEHTKTKITISKGEYYQNRQD